MSNHLYECVVHREQAILNAGGWDYGVPCICKIISDCEIRVEHEQIEHLKSHRDEWIAGGYAAGLHAAHDAVASLEPIIDERSSATRAALAAIDALWRSLD